MLRQKIEGILEDMMTRIEIFGDYKKRFNEATDKILEAVREGLPKIKPEQLHIWYLEVTTKLDSNSYNPKAQVDYEFLSNEQKFIDEYIADKIDQAIAEVKERMR